MAGALAYRCIRSTLSTGSSPPLQASPLGAECADPQEQAHAPAFAGALLEAQRDPELGGGHIRYEHRSPQIERARPSQRRTPGNKASGICRVLDAARAQGEIDGLLPFFARRMDQTFEVLPRRQEGWV